MDRRVGPPALSVRRGRLAPVRVVKTSGGAAAGCSRGAFSFLLVGCLFLAGSFRGLAHPPPPAPPRSIRAPDLTAPQPLWIAAAACVAAPPARGGWKGDLWLSERGGADIVARAPGRPRVQAHLRRAPIPTTPPHKHPHPPRNARIGLSLLVCALRRTQEDQDPSRCRPRARATSTRAWPRGLRPSRTPWGTRPTTRTSTGTPSRGSSSTRTAASPPTWVSSRRRRTRRRSSGT